MMAHSLKCLWKQCIIDHALHIMEICLTPQEDYRNYTECIEQQRCIALVCAAAMQDTNDGYQQRLGLQYMSQYRSAASK
jgi:hypothetical protein